MLNKSFTLASVVSLAGVVVWIGSTTACSSDETPAAGTSTSSSSGDGGGSSGTSGTSGDNGTSGTSGSSGTSGTSSSSSGLVDPKTVEGVDIPYGKCDPFEKAGDSITGNWKVVGGCLPEDTFDQYREACKQLQEHDVIIKAKGTVEATDTNVKQVLSTFLSAKIDLPNSCTALIGGCKAIAGFLTSGALGQKFDHMECAEDGELCKCAGDVKVDETLADEYTKEGTGAVKMKTSGRTFEFQAAAPNLTYRETTKDNRTFSMQLKLGPQ